MRLLKLAVLWMATTACGTSEPPPSPPPEAPPCSPDQPGFPPLLLGQWHRSDIYVAEDWAFAEDCTLNQRSTALVHGAPWSTTERALRYRFENGRLVTLDERDDGLLTTATPIHVNENRLMLDAFAPVGEHSGLVGMWSSTVDTSLTNPETGETKYQTTHIQTLEFTSAMTYTWRKRFIHDGVETPSEENGTYEYNTTYASYVLRPAGAPSSTFTFIHFLDDQALRPGAPWGVFAR